MWHFPLWMGKGSSQKSDSPAFFVHMFFTNDPLYVPHPLWNCFRSLPSGWERTGVEGIPSLFAEKNTESELLKGLNITLLYVPNDKSEFLLVRRWDGRGCAFAIASLPTCPTYAQELTCRPLPRACARSLRCWKCSAQMPAHFFILLLFPLQPVL